MAPISICTPCLRAIRLQARKEILQRHRTPHHPSISRTTTNLSRATFSTSHRSSFPEKGKPAPPKPRSKTPNPNVSTLKSLAASARQKNPTLRRTTEPYVAYGSTEDLFRLCCSAQCSYTIAPREPGVSAPKNAAGEDIGEGSGWWYTPKAQGGLGLDVTFNTWAQVMFLHMYMLTARLRCFPAEHARIWHQQLLDHFFYAAEDRMVEQHNMTARGIRNKYLKDLLNQWRGLLFSYDEGVIKGDAVLAAAVWRNVFKGDMDVDADDLAVVVAYVRREMGMLGRLSDGEVTEARVLFGDPGTLRGVVDGRRSVWMSKSFAREELEGPGEEAVK